MCYILLQVRSTLLTIYSKTYSFLIDLCKVFIKVTLEHSMTKLYLYFSQVLHHRWILTLQEGVQWNTCTVLCTPWVQQYSLMYIRLSAIRPHSTHLGDSCCLSNIRNIHRWVLYKMYTRLLLLVRWDPVSCLRVVWIIFFLHCIAFSDIYSSFKSYLEWLYKRILKRRKVHVNVKQLLYSILLYSIQLCFAWPYIHTWKTSFLYFISSQWRICLHSRL